MIEVHAAFPTATTHGGGGLNEGMVSTTLAGTAAPEAPNQPGRASCATEYGMSEGRTNLIYSWRATR